MSAALARPAPAALRVRWGPAPGAAHLLTADWGRAAHQAAVWLAHGQDTVLLEWVPCALSPLGQLVPLTTPDHPAPTSAHRAWVLAELDATGAVVARPGTASSGVL